ACARTRAADALSLHDALRIWARAGAGLPEHPAGAGLDHVEAGAVRRLGDLHVLLPGAARVEVAQVGGVAVAPADVPQAAAVVVEGGRAVHGLVAAVAVDVADGERVVALARVRAVAGGVGVERPALDQPAVAEVPGGDDAAGVVAAGHDEAGPPPVEVGGPGQEAVHPVAVVVAPGGDVAAGRVVVHGGQGGAGPAVEHGQVLGAGQDVAAGVAVVRAGVADDGAAAVHGAVGGLHRDLGPAVAVVVVDLELGVVRAGPDVAAQVDPPQAGAVQLDAVEVDGVGHAGLGVVLGVVRLPLPHPVQVADAGVVGVVAAGGRGDGHVEVAGGEPERRFGGRALGAAVHRADRVGGVGRGAGVQVVGGVRDGGDAGAAPVDVEGRLAWLGAQQPPGDQVAAAGADADQATVEVLGLLGALGDGRGRDRRGDGRGGLAGAGHAVEREGRGSR